ncbi:alpha/beta fold hydrolase [uncultured Nocardioides sp.]|uniref:alpha/beta hydrolase n=1 Tax=uncultured Nocardioides sp. TaxID=198441 RepID=UPI0026363612|nr:alpha/beta fold hydrolase [uncultured Nocardioides sp.]
MRAREPDVVGEVDRDGVAIHYEVFGSGGPTLLLMGTFPVVDGHQWKGQVPFLSRHFRVVTIDPRGNGRSGRPTGPAAYSDQLNADDALAVLDATGTDAAFLVALCSGIKWSLLVADAAPDRVRGLVAIAPGVHPLAPQPEPIEPVDHERWVGDWAGWVAYHSDLLLPEPHSTKTYDDLVAWALQTDPATITARTHAALRPSEEQEAVDLLGRLDVPVLVIHGTEDRCQPLERGRRVAELTGARFVVIEGAGHVPHARHPVLVNTEIKEFVDMNTTSAAATARADATPWLFARDRKRRALWVCSPIGLGHVLRDLAIARALREQVPDLEIEWLAQSPVSDVVRAHGEIVHPASSELASESAHWESEAEQHDLHAFHAFRRMDEILCANYMLFDDVVRDTSYDLWVGDESWEVDHFLHENPERKIAPYAFLTDVVGFLPVDPEGDPREAELTTDYNAEMIEHRERFPYVRDRSVFIGALGELPSASLGTGLPTVRDWTEKWFTSVPYVVPFDPAAYRRPAALRRELGYGTGYPLYVAAVGGTAVGRDLLRLTAEAFELVRAQEPDARLVMVTGPRIDPAELPDVEGMDKLGYVDGLFAHLAAADAAVVQGGLSTTMELVAARRPFVYFPLAHHWEQQHFVAHRLDHYGAGHRMDYRTTSPRDLAEAMMTARRTRPAYRPIRRGGADKAAGLLASVLTGAR